MALAYYKHIRHTEDFDLGTCSDPCVELLAAKKALESHGFDVDLRLPDADDPLEAMIEVNGPRIRTIEVVNFLNPLARGAELLAEESIRTASPAGTDTGSLLVVDLPHLIALKLHAGGPRSRSDVVELLERTLPWIWPRSATPARGTGSRRPSKPFSKSSASGSFPPGKPRN